MDEGPPIAYEVLEEGVPVYSCDGALVGTVAHVVAAPSLDIFHGIVITVDGSQRFVAADQVAALHERGVDLLIEAQVAMTLPAPHGAAAALRVRDPSARPSRWRRLLDELEGVAPTRRNWTDTD